MNLTFKDIKSRNNIDYFITGKDKMVFYIGFEQSGNLVVQDENYNIHTVSEDKIKDWKIGNYLTNITESCKIFKDTDKVLSIKRTNNICKSK